jgi:hypothetical protein
MLLCARNVMVEAQSVTLGGTASGGALSDINVLRQPYNGTPFVHNKYSFGTGGCWIEFQFNVSAPPYVRALGLLMDQRGPGNNVTYEVRSVGGSLMFSGSMSAVSNGPSFPALWYVDLAPTLPGYVGYNVGRIRFDLDMLQPNDPRAVIRCFASAGILAREYRDRLILRDSSTGDRSLFGSWLDVEGTRRREVAVTVSHVDLAFSYGVLGTDLPDSYGEAFALVGAGPEVMLIHPSARFSMMGRFATRPKIDRSAGVLNTVEFAVREY